MMGSTGYKCNTWWDQLQWDQLLIPLPDEEQHYAVETSQSTSLVNKIIRGMINIFIIIK